MTTSLLSDDAGAAQADRAPFVHPTSLIAGTLVSTDLKRARHMLENAFGLECVQPRADILYARDRGRQTDQVTVSQEMLNHWGMAAPSEAAVDEAYARLKESQAEYGIARVQKPRFRNGSYAFYFTDQDSNWWELEYRAPDLTYDVLRARGDLF